jgi:hypothetical protein
MFFYGDSAIAKMGRQELQEDIRKRAERLAEKVVDDVWRKISEHVQDPAQMTPAAIVKSLDDLAMSLCDMIQLFEMHLAAIAADDSVESTGVDSNPMRVRRTAGSLSEPLCDGADANHHWIVFSTALEQRALMLQCADCGAFGTVDDPSLEEWRAAYKAPSEPYQWHDAARVTIRKPGNW